MQTKNYNVDLCVIGGGLAGLCAAISAAREGISVVLMQDRPVLGGNSSSEIRMWVCGAHGDNNRETGIIEEIMLENFYRNEGCKYAIWDSVLYEKAMLEPNLKLLLNCSCLDTQMDKNSIKNVKGWQSNAETYHVVNAKYFADCSGDSILSTLTGAEFTYGREERAKFNESIAPMAADKKTMGMSCLFQIRETDSPKKFVPPAWAYKYTTDADLPYKDHDKNNNFWWIEVGGEDDCIHDTDACRDELLKIAYGVWDHMKNYGDHGVENWELDWIGFLPGKRESRRYIGKYVVNQNDVEKGGIFDDVIAYGGWTMDDHFPEGFYYKDGHPTIYHPAPSPWGIPMRALYSNNIKNLLFAGRNISVTHSALSSSRVMATCATLGQAVGTAVSMAVKENKGIEAIDIKRLQQTLMRQDAFLPNIKREVSSDMGGVCSAPIIRNGHERGNENLWIGKNGDSISYTFNEGKNISKIRLVFDSNLNRDYHNMPCNYPLVQEKYKLPQTLVKDYNIVITTSSGNVHTISKKDNHQRLVWVELDKAIKNITKLELVPISTWGAEEFRVFGFEFE